jgi:hypothetical protein
MSDVPLQSAAALKQCSLGAVVATSLAFFVQNGHQTSVLMGAVASDAASNCTIWNACSRLKGFQAAPS